MDIHISSYIPMGISCQMVSIKIFYSTCKFRHFISITSQQIETGFSMHRNGNLFRLEINMNYFLKSCFRFYFRLRKETNSGERGTYSYLEIFLPDGKLLVLFCPWQAPYRNFQARLIGFGGGRFGPVLTCLGPSWLSQTPINRCFSPTHVRCHLHWEN